MKKLHPELVEEYFESIRDSYPNLTLEECNKIVSAPFLATKQGIESGDFPTIRLKFFGTFVAYPKRVAAILKQYETMFKEQRITPVNYFKKKKQLETFLNKENESKSKL